MGCTDAVGLARDFVLADDNRRFVVVSAPGKACQFSRKVTDLLIESHTQLCLGEQSDSFESVLKRFADMAKHLDIDMNPELQRCREEVQIHRCQRDFVVSRGEYLMAVLFAKVLDFRFLDAAKFIVIKKSGLVDEKQTAHNLSKLDKSGKYVMGGFYGRLPNGGVKTFARGGSDYSGAVVACLIGAHVYENMTDTHGVQSANPALIPDTKTLRFMDYNSLYKLALGGAGVIFPECLPLLKKHQVKLVIDNTFNSGKRWTTVTDMRSQKPFFSITYNGSRSAVEVLIVLEKVRLEYSKLKEILEGLEVYVSMFKRSEIRILVGGDDVNQVVTRLHTYLET